MTKHRKLMKIVQHFRSHSVRATTKHLTRPIARIRKNLTWGWVVPALWPLLLGVITFVGTVSKKKAKKSRRPSTFVMLVHDPSEKRRFNAVGPDITERMELWLREQIPSTEIVYTNSLAGLPYPDKNCVAIANYDWLVRLEDPGALRRILREVSVARKRGWRVCSAPIDLWGVRLNLYGSLLVALTGGWTLVSPNSPNQARAFLLPNPWAALWNWPKIVSASWSDSPPWKSKRKRALIPISGDPRRQMFFQPLSAKLEDRGYAVGWTDQRQPWNTYVSEAKSSRLVFTTCWVQEIFHVGPSYFRQLISDGHITNRVWEGFASSATVFTNKVRALEEFGFKAGVHYVALPESAQQWETWQIPDDHALETIAASGHISFRKLVEDSSLPPDLSNA